MKLHGYFWFQFEMSETSGFTPVQCWRGNLVCGAENKEKLHSEIATETFQTNFHSPCIWVWNETKYINVSIVTSTRLEYIHVIPISSWTLLQFRAGILLLTALHLFNSFSLLSYSRSVCSWGFSLEYYVENHWIKLSDCRNEPSRWFLCFTIWRCCRYCDGNIMCS